MRGRPARLGRCHREFKIQEALHEAGKYLSGKPLVAAGPQRQLAMGLPPSVLPLTAVLPV